MEKLYIFLLILLTGTVYAVIGNAVLLGLSTVVLLALFFKNINATYNVNLISTYVILSTLLAVVLAVHFLVVPMTNSPLPYIGMLFRVSSLGLFWVYLRNKKLDFCELLQSVLKIIAIHAVIAWVLSFFVSNFLIRVPTESINSYTFGYVFFYNASFKLLGITFYRNQGIFWEPGILQIYMNTLFFIVSFVKPNKKFQLLSAALIITTYSTTGIGLLLLQLTVILFTAKISTIRKLLISFALGVIMLPIFILNYQEKISDNSTDTDITSSALRIYDILEGVEIAKEYPFTGIGLSQEAYAAFKKSHSALTSNFSEEFSDFVLTRRSSNSILYFLTRFGFPFSLFWFFLIYRQGFIRQKRWLIFVIIIIENFSEPLLIEPFFLLFAASGFYELTSIKFKNLSQSSASNVI